MQHFSTRSLLVGLISLTILVLAKAQQPSLTEVSYRQISLNEGLPSQTVYDIHQDDDGWIWIATPAGLFRYDGVRFQQYTSSLARQSDIHDLRRGPRGELFARNFRQQLFCVSGDSLALVGDYSSLTPRFISYGFYGEQLLISSQTGYSVFSYDLYPRQGWPLNNARPTQTYETDKPATLHGIGIRGAIIANNLTATREPFLKGEGYFDRTQAGGLFVESTNEQQGANLIVTRSLQKPQKLFIHQADRSGAIREVNCLTYSSDLFSGRKVYAQQATDGNLLLGCARGLLLVPKRNVGSADSDLNEAINLLPGKTVNRILFDKDGMLWVATAHQGVLLIPNLEVFKHTFSDLQSPLIDLSSDPSSQQLYGLSSVGGVYTLTKKAITLFDNSLHQRFWRDDRGQTYLSTVPVAELKQDKDQLALEVNHGSLKEALILSDGTILLANSSRLEVIAPGLDPLDKERLSPGLAKRMVHLDQGHLDVLSLRDQRASGVAYLAQNNCVYVAFADSLVSYQLPSWQASAVAFSGVTGRVAKVAAFGGQLLLSLADGGLLLFDPETKQQELFLSDIITKRIQIVNDKAWLQTNKGVYRMSRVVQRLSVELIDTRYGLLPGIPSALHATKDHVYAAYDKTVVRIESDAVPLRARVDEVVAFAKTRIDGSVVPVQEASVELTADVQSLTLYPSIADYTQSPVLTFEYRWIDRESKWSNTSGDDGAIAFNSLPEGRRKLAVRLSNEPSTMSTFTVDAKLPFWRKPYPYLIGMLLLSAFAIYVTKKRSEVREAKAQYHADLRESQLTALAAQMNPHFIFNALNSVQDFMMANDKLAANDYLTRFSKLIRLTLMSSRSMTILLSEELRMVDHYLELERIRFDDEIDIEFIEDARLPLSSQLPPLIVQPYIENAFKHGLQHRRGERYLRVHYALADEQTLRVTVEDNGVGRLRAAELTKDSTSNKFATGATDRRLVLLNVHDSNSYRVVTEDLYEHGVASGTRVTLHLRLTIEQSILKTI